jgi:tRNA A37 threonylcarbamoyltransferase TsaD
MKLVLKELASIIIIPPLWCTTDNAAMIAKVAEHLYREKALCPVNPRR